MWTLPSSSQTVTKTVPVDTMVILPKRLVTFMIKDIQKSEGKNDELKSMNQKINEKNDKIFHLTTTNDSLVTANDSLSKQVVTCEATVSELSNIDVVNQTTINNLNKEVRKYKRQRNALKIFSNFFI